MQRNECDSYTEKKKTGKRKCISEGLDVKLKRELEVVITIMFKEQKENMFKEVKEEMVHVCVSVGYEIIHLLISVQVMILGP